MTQQQSIFRITILICLWVVSFSCRKMVTVNPPKNELTTPVVFSDSANALAAVNGLYVKMMGGATQLLFGNGALTIFTALAADEISYTYMSGEPYEFQNNSINKESNTNGELWAEPYRIIYLANACLDGLEKSKTISVTFKENLTAEAMFVRAFVYFNLASLYGDIPYVASPGYAETGLNPRTNKDSVLKIIAADLVETVSILPSVHRGANKVSPTRFTALALLARIYLYRQEYDKAAAAASQVIDAGLYTMETDLSAVFKANSRESVWALPPLQAGFETTEGFIFVPYSAGQMPEYTITDQLYNTFEEGDNRKINWVNSILVNNTSYLHPYKYKFSYDGNTSPVEHYTILRLAEQYLIRAEAKAMLNDFNGSQSDLNIIRTRAGLTPSTAADQASLLAAIGKERRVELFCEWGHRWYDLKRTRTINEALQYKPDWQATDSLFPIPFSEMQLNPYLVQNPGY